MFDKVDLRLTTFPAAVTAELSFKTKEREKWNKRKER